MAAKQGDKMTGPVGEAIRTHLSVLWPCDAVVVADGDGWSAFLPGLPFFTAYGADYDEVIDDLIVALREYAEDWNDHLHDAPNHRDHWVVVALAGLSTDEQLRGWLLTGETSGVIRPHYQPTPTKFADMDERIKNNKMGASKKNQDLE